VMAVSSERKVMRFMKLRPEHESGQALRARPQHFPRGSRDCAGDC